MPSTIKIEGIVAEIRPMDATYIVGDDGGASGVNVEIQCCLGHAAWPNPPYVAYFRKLVEAYGSAAICAWQDSNLVGFLPFIPLDCGMLRLPHCISARIDDRAAEIRKATPTPFADLRDRTLKVQCLSVARRLQRRGIGTAMARELIDWARERGWHRVQGWAFADGTVDDSYRWLPSIQFWEGAGFERGIERVFDASDPVTNKPGFEFFIELEGSST